MPQTSLRNTEDEELLRLGQHFVVKFGFGINLIEGENMLFISKNTSVPVPRVYALYADLNNGKRYIIIERVIS